MAERVCMYCGSTNYYAKKLCRSCYNGYLRSGAKSPDEYISWKTESELQRDKIDVIRAIRSTLKLNLSELAREIGVSRQRVHQWFVHNTCTIPSPYIDKVYEWMMCQAQDAIAILTDFCA